MRKCSLIPALYAACTGILALASPLWAEEIAESKQGRSENDGPTIMVFVEERIHDYEPRLFAPAGRDPYVTTEIDSKLANAVARELRESGFRVKFAPRVEKLREDAVKSKALDGTDVRELAAIAREAGAEIFVQGTLNAEGPRIKDDPLTGQRLYFWLADGTFHAYWSDTGEYLFGLQMPQEERTGGRNITGRAGAAIALEQTANALARNCAEKLRVECSVRRAAVVLQVTGSMFSDSEKLREKINSISGARNVHDGFDHGVTRFELELAMSSRELAKLLDGWKCGDGSLTIVSVKRNLVEAEIHR